MGSMIGAWKVAGVKTGVDAQEWLNRHDAGQKWCRLCRAWQPATAFVKDKTRYDGLSAACRDSRNARERALYGKRPYVGRARPDAAARNPQGADGPPC